LRIDCDRLKIGRIPKCKYKIIIIAIIWLNIFDNLDDLTYMFMLLMYTSTKIITKTN